MREVINTDKRYHAQWFSWAEWIDHVDRVSPKQGGGARGGSQSWSGTSTFAQAIDLARYGWLEGADKLQTMSRPIIDKLTSIIERPTFVYDVEGSMFDMGRVIEGDPECFMRQELELADGAQKHLRLVFDIGQRCDVSAERMIERGSVVVALIEALEHAGRRVEVWGGNCSSFYGGGSTMAELFVRVKKAEDPLDLPKLAFAMAHPSSFRRLVFSAMEWMPQVISGKWAIGVYGSTQYGYSSPDLKSDIELKGLFEGNATEMIIKELAKQGVEVH